jgi:hypothetical protein
MTFDIQPWILVVDQSKGFWDYLGILAAVGSVGVAIYVYLRQSKLMRETMIMSHRARVDVKELRKDPLYKESDGPLSHWRFIPQMVNSGNSATLRGVTTTYSRISSSELDDKSFDYPAEAFHGKPPHVSPISMGPNSELGGVSVSVDVATLKEIGEKSKFLYIWGWIDYNDVFPDTPRYRTEFSFELVVRASPFREDANAFKTPHLWKHHGSDDECFRNPATYEAGLAGDIGLIRARRIEHRNPLQRLARRFT